MAVRYKILVVDDMKENIDILFEILKVDYDVMVARDGFTAMELAGSQTPDLILLDVMMPDMDGYFVCEQLKANPATKYIPVIFLTARYQEIDETRGFEVGAVDYVIKPVKPLILLSRIKAHTAMHNRQKELDIAVYQRTKALQESRMDIINILGRAAEYKDNETGLHVVRVSEYCYQIALQMGLNDVDARLLRDASPMHDIGKIGIEDRILRKPGKLDEDEWETMITHTHIGSDIFGDQDSRLLKMAKQIAYEHHEKADGSGYPNGLKADEISLPAKIVAVADVFDALTSDRPYKKAWTFEEAVKYIAESKGTHFDEDVVNAFIVIKEEIFKIYSALQES